jgi:hypothetical protein
MDKIMKNIKLILITILLSNKTFGTLQTTESLSSERIFTPSHEESYITAQDILSANLIINLITENLNTNTSETLFIGIGRSPFIIIEVMKAKGFNAINIPLTWSGTKYKEDLELELSDRDKKQLFSHFNQYLFDLENIKEHNIIIIDFAISGKGIYISEKHLNSYLIEMLGTTIHKSIVLWLEESASREYERTRLTTWININLSTPQLIQFSERLVTGHFKEYSQYGQWIVGEINLEEENPSYLRTKYLIGKIFFHLYELEKTALLLVLKEQTSSLLNIAAKYNVPASSCFDLQTRSINLNKIKRIYKKICLKTHPDKTSDQDKIEDFKKVQDLYTKTTACAGYLTQEYIIYEVKDKVLLLKN